MTTIAELQIRVDTTQLDQAKTSLQQLSNSAQNLSTGTKKVATKATSDFTKLAESIDPVRKKMRELEEQQEQLNKAYASGNPQAVASYSQLNGIIEGQRKRIQDLGATTGKTAKEINFALRGLPAQFTDIFVSLQGGQEPLTVLLQQGGQLKDMFGGVGVAAKAMGGYILGLVNPYTIAAGAVAGLTLAYYQGSKEADAYRLALVSTGNAAGTTVGELSRMAEAVGNITGNTGEAAKVLAQLANNTKIDVSSFERVTEVIVGWSKVSGEASEELVKQFSEIAKDPLEAVVKLNEKYNFLTAEIYNQIVALERQGKTQEAAKLITEEHANTLAGRTQEMVNNLGYVERAWNAVKTASKSAWDSILDVGRPVDDITSQVQELEKTLKNMREGGPRGDRVYSQDAIKAVEDELKALKETQKYRMDMENWAANQRKEQQDAENRSITNIKAIGDQYKALQEQIKGTRGEIEALDKQWAAIAEKDRTPQKEKEYLTVRASLVEKAAKEEQKVAQVRSDSGEKLLTSLRQQGAALEQQAITVGKVGSEQKKYQELVQQFTDLEIKQKEKGLTLSEKQVLAVKDQALAQQKLNIEKEIENKKNETALKLETIKAELQQRLANNAKKYSDAIAGAGLSRTQLERMRERNALEDEYADLLAKAGEERRKTGDEQAYQDQVKEYKKYLEDRKRAQRQHWRDMDRLQADWTKGATAAWGDYLDGVRDVSGQTYDLFTNAFKGIEDYLVSFITGTKKSFKDLVTSIATDLVRMQVRGTLTDIFGGTQGGAQGGGISGFLSNIFGGGQGGGGGVSSLFNFGKNAYSFSQSGFAQAVVGGWNGGQGLLGGIQGAISGGFKSITSSISGLFSGSVNSAAAGASQAGYTGAAYSNWVKAGNMGIPWLQGIGGALQGYQRAGVKGAVTGGAGAVGGYYAGAAIGSLVGPLGTIVGGAIGSALGGFLGSSVFGGKWQTKDVGIALGVDAGELDAKRFEYQKKKGGLFSSNKKRTRYYDLDPETAAALNDTYDATEKSVIDLFKELSYTVDDAVFDGLTVARTKISTKGKTEEEIQQAITEWFVTLADTMTASLNTTLETGLDMTYEEMSAFVNNLLGVNEVIRYLNVGMYDASVAGGKLAEALSAAAGGLDALAANSATYYGAFFTEAERMDDTLDAVTRAFEAADVQLAESREAYRAMVEDIDITTEAGQEMFATLMALSGQAAAYYDILESRAAQAAAAQAQLLIGNVNSAYSALQRSIDVERERLTRNYQAQLAAEQQAASARSSAYADMIDTANSNVQALRGLDSALDRALKTLLGTSDTAVEMMRKQAVSLLQDALTVGRSGKSLAGIEGLEDALDTASKVDTAVYSSLVDFEREQGRTANLIAELEAINGKQLTAEERLLAQLQASAAAVQSGFGSVSSALTAEYERAMAALDEELAAAQAQLDALNGIDNSVMSVAAAVAQMSASVTAAMGGQSAAIQQLYQSILGSGADTEGVRYWEDRIDETGNYTELINALQAAASGRAGMENAIAGLYQQAGQTVDSEGIRYWSEAISSGRYDYDDLRRGLNLPQFSTGGAVRGAGTSTSDSILARLSNGEFVMSAKAVAAYGLDYFRMLNNLQVPGFASGGSVDIQRRPMSMLESSKALSEKQADTIIQLLERVAGYSKTTAGNSGTTSSLLRDIAETGIMPA